ncbi:hypothetical protein F4819DRAFT_509304 [Hypoxylon fuscum]|nr:hypothetical protein F4819DRAFT_509304 [Hypoxylon fuscum]
MCPGSFRKLLFNSLSGQISPSYTMTTSVSRDSSSGGGAHSGITLVIIIISATIGTMVIITLAFIGYIILHRRRKNAYETFEAARLRDPTLTWEKHTQRRRLTLSRLLFENELQRSNLIRKSLQSRSYANEVTERNEGEADEFMLRASRDSGNYTSKAAYVKGQEDPKSGNCNQSGDIITRPTELNEEGKSLSSPMGPLNTPPVPAHPALRGWPSRESSLRKELTQTRITPLE